MGSIRSYHIFLVMILMILLSMAYVSVRSEPLHGDMLEKIRENNPKDIHQIEKNRMEIFFIKERGWTFLIFSSFILSILIWLAVVKRRQSNLNFLNYRFRLQNRLDQIEMETIDFQDRLKKKFALLSSNDLLVAEMLVNGYSTKKISSELNISVSSANTARYRLRKKMNLAKETDLVDFLREI